MRIILIALFALLFPTNAYAQRPIPDVGLVDQYEGLFCTSEAASRRIGEAFRTRGVAGVRTQSQVEMVTHGCEPLDLVWGKAAEELTMWIHEDEIVVLFRMEMVDEDNTIWTGYMLFWEPYVRYDLT